MRNSTRAEAIANMLGQRSIVFVGMMGSGKTAIGRVVSNDLGLPFFDSDAEIVAAAGMSIPEIFAQFGEGYFRSGERRVITRLLAEGPCVLSLGGGAFVNPETRLEIARSGITIWLRADVELLLSRVLARPHARPLLQTTDPRATLIDLLERRTPIYALADIAVDSSRLSKRQTGDDVLDALENWLTRRASALEE